MRQEKYSFVRAPETFYGTLKAPIEVGWKKAPVTMYGGEF